MWKLVVNVTWSCRLASADRELSRNNLSWRLEDFFLACGGMLRCRLQSLAGRRPIERNPKPRMKSLWHPGFTFYALSYTHFVAILRSRPSWILILVFLSHWENFNLKNDSKDPFNRKSSFGNNYTSHLVWTKNYLESFQERVRLHGANEVWRLVLVFRLLV